MSRGFLCEHKLRLRNRNRHLDLIRGLAFLSVLIQGRCDVEVALSALDRAIGEGGVRMRVGIYLRIRSFGLDSAVYVVADNIGSVGEPRESDAVRAGLRSVGAECFRERRVRRVADEADIPGGTSALLRGEGHFK